MGAHPDGTGTGWDACEAVDVDQPEGLDYRYVVHVAKAVRKRSNKEHEAYGDTTAGGEHLPGGCRILGIVDATADLTAAEGDASHDVTTAKFIGRAIMYDQTSNVLWCLTNTDGTTTGDPYALMWGPKSICLGADYSWTGTHEFSSVDISGSLDLTGHFACGSEVVGEVSASFSGEVDISQTLNCASKATFINDVSINASLKVDGTSTEFGGTAGVGLFYDPTVYAGGQTQTIPTGLILKCGTATFVTGAGTDISYAAGFPNDCIGVFIQARDINPNVNDEIKPNDVSENGFTGVAVNTNNQPATWMAIGY